MEIATVDHESASVQPAESTWDVGALARGDSMVSFGASFVMFWVRGHSEAQSQRMTMSSLAAFTGAGTEDQLVVLSEELLGGRAYNPDELIATPPYTYKMVLSEESHAIYREYMPPRNSGGDSFGLNADLFSQHRLSLTTLAARRLVDEADVARAANSGLIINGLAHIARPGSERGIALQFPIRYFSVRSGDQSQFHAEAGPILVPRAALGDGDMECPESMHIAQIGFNRWDEAEIAIWQAQPAASAASRWFSRICKLKADLSFLVRHDFE